MSNPTVPRTQTAVQLTGPGRLEVNGSKEVHAPGPHQILLKVEAVGLCFSDLKLLKQFSGHSRKSEVVGGLTPEELHSIASYVPGDKPTVPGHEVVGRVVAVGEGVRHHRIGERVLVLPDFRALATASSNGAFGYNFEGGLQEYVLMDERIVIEAGTGERYLIPVEDRLGASQAALVEPWSCVEDSYVTGERQHIKAGGTLLVVAEPGHAAEGLAECLSPDGKPGKVLALLADEEQREALVAAGLAADSIGEPGQVPDESCDDVVYFGASRERLEALNPKLARCGIMNVVTGGKRIGEPVSAGVGRVHYGLTRWVGTRSTNAADGYAVIPRDGELRDGDSVLVVGAGGPMGQMHVIRAICSGRKNLRVTGTDFDEARLASLAKKAAPMARANGVRVGMVNPKERALEGEYSYIALMAPVPELVEDAIQRAAPNSIVNIFAGIPSPVCHPLDLDRMIERRCFVFGTSGSTIRDMRIVLEKVTEGTLNTNASVDAISGMAGAIDGMAAVEHRTMAGKIIVYPELANVGLIPLDQLGEQFPTVAEKLEDGQWCKEAERELLRVAAQG